MKRKRTSFTTAIIRHLPQSHKAAGTRNGDDMPMIPSQHCRQEFAHSPVVRYRVYFKHGSDYALRFVEDGAFFADAGVIDEHRWIAVVGADEGASLFDTGGGCDVAFVEECVFGYIPVSSTLPFRRYSGRGRTERSSRLLDISDDHFDAFACEAVRNVLADSATSACQEDDFAGPVVFV